MLTLLCGANPIVCKRGPSVRVQAGKHQVRYDGVLDSEFVIVLDASGERLAAKHEALLHLDSPQILHVEFEKRGSEKYVSVSVRKL